MQRNYSYTYIELMDDRNRELPEFKCYDLGEGMLFFAHAKKGIGFCYLINTKTEECFELMDKYGNLSSFSIEDIDIRAIEDLPFTSNIFRLNCGHGILLDDFHNGTARFRWTYFIDETPYRALDDITNYKRLYGYIDKHCRVVVKFQPMNEQRLRQFEKQQIIGFDFNR